MTKPDCYKCKYRGVLPGDAHSRCNHPANYMNTVSPIDWNTGKRKQLIVKGEEYGIKSGWFNYPLNFDPVWLLECNGFVAKC